MQPVGNARRWVAIDALDLVPDHAPVEVPPEVTPPGLALELRVTATHAWWKVEDKTILRGQVVGEA